jgi:hypothetical protein
MFSQDKIMTTRKMCCVNWRGKIKTSFYAKKNSIDMQRRFFLTLKKMSDI